MAPVRAALLLSLLSLTAGLPSQESSPADQLTQLLGPVVESAVARALSSWQPPALSDLARLQARLDAVDRDLADLKLTSLAGSRCQQWVPALCDFSHDGGGWTLLLTAATRDGWDPLSVFGRNQRSPSLTDNYAILRHADAMRDLGSGGRFAYRIEAQAEMGRRRWGGVWLAPRRYSFVHETTSQTEVSIVRKFNNWSYKNNGIEKRMPWLNTGNGHAVLTTSASPVTGWWGTLVPDDTVTGHQHSPWIHPEAQRSGTVLYWMREEML